MIYRFEGYQEHSLDLLVGYRQGKAWVVQRMMTGSGQSEYAEGGESRKSGLNFLSCEGSIQCAVERNGFGRGIFNVIVGNLHEKHGVQR